MRYYIISIDYSMVGLYGVMKRIGENSRRWIKRKGYEMSIYRCKRRIIAIAFYFWAIGTLAYYIPSARPAVCSIWDKVAVAASLLGIMILGFLAGREQGENNG